MFASLGRSLAPCLAAWLLLALPLSAAAQDTVGEMMKDAERALSEGEHAQARALYRRAHAERPSAQTSFGLANSAFALQDYAEAVREGRAAMQSQLDPLTAEQRGRAHQIVTESIGRVAQYQVALSPSHAELAVDGEPVQLHADGVLLVLPGRRRIDALADGYLPRSVEVVARAGEQQQLGIELEKIARSAAGFTAEEEEDADDDGGDFPVVPVILVSTGGALLIAGGITGLIAVGDEGDLEDRCGQAPERCPDRYAGLADSAEDLAVVTNVLWVAGGLVAAVGTTWLVLELSDDDGERASATLDLAHDRAGLRLWGRF